jgi:hypothetical protein
MGPATPMLDVEGVLLQEHEPARDTASRIAHAQQILQRRVISHNSEGSASQVGVEAHA